MMRQMDIESQRIICCTIMKTSIRSASWSLFVGLALTALFFSSPATAEIRLTAAANADVSANSPHSSPGVSDVLKMVDAKIDADVITAYIHSSRIPYSPSVNEIIELKQRGVSSVILTAMLQHGGELRAQMAQVNSTVPAPNPYPGTATPYPATPAYDYGAQPVYSYDPYAYSYPAYGYSYYPYYGYGYNYWGS